MNQLSTDNELSYLTENQFKTWIADVYKSFQTHQKSPKEWMSIKEAREYIGVSHNTFTKYREMGLKICEIDKFLNKFSY